MQKKSREELLAMLLKDSEENVVLYNEALRYIHHSMFKTIQQLIVRKGGTKEIAEDIFWEGMMEIDRWAKQRKFTSDSNVEGFLRTVCERKWFKMVERDKHLINAELPIELDRLILDEESSTILLPEKLKPILDDLMVEIGVKCREKLSLYFYRGLSHQEIADQLNLASRNVVTIAIARCIKRLKVEVEGAGGWDLFTD